MSHTLKSKTYLAGLGVAAVEPERIEYKAIERSFVPFLCTKRSLPDLVEAAANFAQNHRLIQYECQGDLEKAINRALRGQEAKKGNAWPRVESLFETKIAENDESARNWIKEQPSPLGLKFACSYKPYKLQTVAIASQSGQVLIWKSQTWVGLRSLLSDSKRRKVVTDPRKYERHLKKTFVVKNLFDVRGLAARKLNLDKHAIGKRHFCDYLFDTDLDRDWIRRCRKLDWSLALNVEQTEILRTESICALVSYLVLDRMKTIEVETLFLKTF